VFSRGGKYGPAGRAHGQQDWARPFLMAALAQSHTCVSNLPRNSRKAVYGTDWGAPLWPPFLELPRACQTYRAISHKVRFDEQIAPPELVGILSGRESPCLAFSSTSMMARPSRSTVKGWNWTTLKRPRTRPKNPSRHCEGRSAGRGSARLYRRCEGRGRTARLAGHAVAGRGKFNPKHSDKILTETTTIPYCLTTELRGQMRARTVPNGSCPGAFPLAASGACLI
jgi:hypothetical protein